MKWDQEFDVIVVGSGASGFAAATTATLEGLDTLLIEKENVFGGASAYSGGGIWIPNNRYLMEAGVGDSYEEAKLYLDTTVGERTPDVIKETYLKKGVEMLDYFHNKAQHMRFFYAKDYSDYYAHLPGGKAHGRSIEPHIFDLRKLGEWYPLMRKAAMDTKGFVMTGQDFKHINMITRTMEGKFRSLTLGMRLVRSKLTGAKLASLGQALMARMALSYKEAKGKLWVNTAFEDFMVEDSRVIGIQVKREGETQFLRAKKGVILSSGGFSRDEEKREKYLPKPTKVEWTSVPPGQTGDIITPAEKLGAKFDLMDRVWGAPSIINHNGQPFFLVAERAIPRMIIVDQDGNRYLNEAKPYHEFVDDMYAHNEKTGGKAVHSWLIIDREAKKRYLFGGQFPGQEFPKEYFEHNIVYSGDTVETLAEKISMKPESLRATIDRFNGFARNGKDEDFGRGDVPYDNYYGDPSIAKNPNLDPFDKGPFYAIRVYPGDISTKGGVEIDEHARVMKEDGTPIEGVYAAGNCSAAIMGTTYPGPGATIGPGMTFGYIAAMDCKNQ